MIYAIMIFGKTKTVTVNSNLTILASTFKHFAKPPQTPKKFSLFLFYIVYSLAVFLCLWFKFFNKIAEIQPHKINIPKLQI